MGKNPRLDSNNIVDTTTRLTWMARMTRIPILATLTSMTRLRRVVRLDGLTSLDRLNILARVIGMARLTGKDTKEGLYGLTGMATQTRLTRMVGPTSRHMYIRGKGYGRASPKPDPGRIGLTRMALITITTWRLSLTRLTRG